jgi:hypothetical protein
LVLTLLGGRHLRVHVAVLAAAPAVIRRVRVREVGLNAAARADEPLTAFRPGGEPPLRGRAATESDTPDRVSHNG